MAVLACRYSDMTVDYLFYCMFSSYPQMFPFTVSLLSIFLRSTFLINTVCPSGLWFDLEISYSGSFLMTLETKMNLIRLGKEGESVRVGEFGKDG